MAHVRKEENGQWAEPHWLDDHLRGTAEKASQFASIFDSAEWGYAAGISHDLGKSPQNWQKYLCKKSGFDEHAHLENISGKMEHSAPGAKYIEEIWGKRISAILSYCIAGHHTGLPDWIGTQGALTYRLQNTKIEGIPDYIKELINHVPPKTLPRSFERKGLDLSLWIRMLFSCLSDADFLDTERYMNIDQHQNRSRYLSVNILLELFNNHMTKMKTEAPSSIINQVRESVLNDCRNSAMRKPGFFSLTVPTGGGKTLSSMAFALEHSVRFKKDRVIYVIPYTSIIEQNADVFRNVFGADQVVEHHSNINDQDLTAKSRLAAENWDAPIIVTTSVQFFESLFAVKTSRTRKLHNICNSVVILDEAQLVPVEFLTPILRTMELLVKFYKVTFVICTATQPAFEKRDDSPDFPGIPKNSIGEIINDVPSLYKTLKRVKIEIPDDLTSVCTWNEIAQELKLFESVLCIVSERKSCKELFHLMPEGTYHLSALMCAQHRSEIITKIKSDLKFKRPVRVISTQLVEAGVDLDFPVVYRAIAGLDSIAQAAGRCNREGLLNVEDKLGKVVVFVPQKKAPSGFLRKAAETTTRLLSQGLPDPIDQCVFPCFFSELYWKANNLDRKRILDLLKPEESESGIAIQFRTAADAFNLIDDSMQRSVLIPFGEGKELIQHLKEQGPVRNLIRKLQRYTVNVYENDFNELLNRGSLEEVSIGFFALLCEVEYDSNTGLKVNDNFFNPEPYIN
jgi:CRISPR-associated endonuclease/helicase Cas3